MDYLPQTPYSRDWAHFVAYAQGNPHVSAQQTFCKDNGFFGCVGEDWGHFYNDPAKLLIIGGAAAIVALLVFGAHDSRSPSQKAASAKARNQQRANMMKMAMMA